MCLEEVDLWRTVISQAIEDAISQRLDDETRAHVRSWICNKNLDFEMVCSFANFDEEALRSQFLKKESEKNNKKINK